MKNVKIKVDEFLKKFGMHFQSIDIEKDCKTFMHEMEKGLCGEDSSLKMLCTYLSPEGEIPVNEPVIVMDAGGTNFRVAVVSFDENKQAKIEDFKLYPMPGTRGEISKEEFFNTVADYLMPVIDRSGKIGFCFSYPTEILPSKDGKLIRFDKEVRVRNMEGEEIGSQLLNTLRKKGIREEKKIVILNDTVATLLGGKAVHPGRKFSDYIGFILGTGTNTCYVEENSNIQKAPSLLGKQGTTIINIESGGYRRTPRGEIDVILDNRTSDPGSQQFEKMVSGAYQGSLLLEVIRKAIEEGLFSKQVANQLSRVENLTSREIDDFCFYPYSKNNVLARCFYTEDSGNDADRITLYHIIDAIFERAAKLVAVNLASIICKTGKGKNPCLSVCIAVEGTTFYKSKLFKGKLDYYVKNYMNEQKGIYCEFIKAENATLIGTAIAGLLN